MKRSTRLAAALLLGLAPAVVQTAPAHAAPPKASAGWAVALIGSANASSRTLTLVAPDGRQYPIRSVGSDWYLWDVTPDGRKVLLMDPSYYIPTYAVGA